MMNNKVYIIFLLLTFFFFFPFLGIILSTFFLIGERGTCTNKEKRQHISLFIIMCSLMLGLINITKVPENDLVWYMDHFHEAKNTNLLYFMRESLTTWTSSSWKEPIYSLLVWIINRLSGDDGAFFKCFITILNYLFLNASIYLFAKRFGFPSRFVIFGIVTMCFIPYIFTMSMHLIRQFLANSILMFVAIQRCFYDKKNYWLMLLGALIHSTSILFFPILLIPAYDKHPKDTKFWYFSLIIILLAYQIIARVLGLFVGTDSVMSYAIQRASRDTTYEFGGTMAFPKILMVILCMIYALYISFNSIYKNVAGIKRFMNIIIFLCLFILVNVQQQELSIRFFFFLFPFVPFYIMLTMGTQKLSLGTIRLCCIALFLFFAIYLYIGTWSYELPNNIFVSPIYLFQEPSV